MAPVVQKVDSAIHRINLYPVDSAIGFPNTSPLNSVLSDGQRDTAFEQLGSEEKKEYSCKNFDVKSKSFEMYLMQVSYAKAF